MSFIIVLSLFIVPVILWRKLYFRPLTAVKVTSEGKYIVCSIKPSRSFFKTIVGGHKLGCVKIGFKHVAFFVDNPDAALIQIDDSFIPGDLYIYSTGFLGRLRSVDVSARSYVDSIKKFKFN